MAAAKYHHHKGPGYVSQVPFAASQRFAATGAAFIHLDASGHATKSLNATAGLAGWFSSVGFSLDHPECALDSNGIAEYTTSSTAGTEYGAMIASSSDVFLVPTSAAYAAARLGETCDITGVANNNSGNVQQAILGTTATDVLRVIGGTVGVSEAYVSIYTFQADT
jgi:hypothetical protein